MTDKAIILMIMCGIPALLMIIHEIHNQYYHNPEVHWSKTRWWINTKKKLKGGK